KERTYGFGRTSILASLFNSVTLLIAVGGIVWGAADKLLNPSSIETTTVMWVATTGIIINGGTALMFMRGGRHDLNLRGAFLHMAYDALISLGVVVSALVIAKTGMTWVDPAASLVIAAVIGMGSVRLLRDSADLTLDAVPRGIDHAEVKKFLGSA